MRRRTIFRCSLSVCMMGLYTTAVQRKSPRRRRRRRKGRREEPDKTNKLCVQAPYLDSTLVCALLGVQKFPLPFTLFYFHFTTLKVSTWHSGELFYTKVVNITNAFGRHSKCTVTFSCTITWEYILCEHMHIHFACFLSSIIASSRTASVCSTES